MVLATFTLCCSRSCLHWMLGSQPAGRSRTTGALLENALIQIVSSLDVVALSGS